MHEQTVHELACEYRESGKPERYPDPDGSVVKESAERLRQFRAGLDDESELLQQAEADYVELCQSLHDMTVTDALRAVRGIIVEGVTILMEWIASLADWVEHVTARPLMTGMNWRSALPTRRSSYKVQEGDFQHSIGCARCLIT